MDGQHPCVQIGTASQASASAWTSESLVGKVLIWGSENIGTKPPWDELWLEIFEADNVASRPA